MVHKKIILKFKKIQYNLMGFLIVILFVVSTCTAGNLITSHLKHESVLYLQHEPGSHITLTCPGPESTLGPKVCCSSRSKD